MLKEKKLLSENGLSPEQWMVDGSDAKYLHVVHKKTGERKLLIKNAPLPESKKGHKEK